MMSENEREEYEKSDEYKNSLLNARKQFEGHINVVLAIEPLKLRSVISIATHMDVDPIGDDRVKTNAVMAGPIDRIVDSLLDCVEELITQDKSAAPLLLMGILQRKDRAMKKMMGEAVPTNKLDDKEAKDAVEQAMKNMFNFAKLGDNNGKQN